jgi:PilZ domain
MAQASGGRGADRRVAPRLPVCWTGLVLSGPQAHACMVRDLSPTGANLGHVGALRRSQVVGLQVRHGRGQLTLAARVAWIDETSHQAGVAFLGATHEASIRLRDALASALRRLRSGPSGQVLIVGLDAEDADDVKQAARACGLSATCVHTPLDAIRKLISDVPPTAVVAAPSLAGTAGQAFLELVERERPQVARILVADAAGPLQPTPGAGPKVLYKPWDAVELGDALDAAVHPH